MNINLIDISIIVSPCQFEYFNEEMTEKKLIESSFFNIDPDDREKQIFNIVLLSR